MIGATGSQPIVFVDATSMLGGKLEGAIDRQVAEHTSSLFRLELELAQLELKKKVTSLGLGIGLAIAAAVFAFYGLGFLFATIAAGLATAMSTWLAILIVIPTWAALLIVAGILLVAIAILGFLAVNRIQKGTPPIPEQAIEEAKLTTEAIKSNGN